MKSRTRGKLQGLVISEGNYQQECRALLGKKEEMRMQSKASGTEAAEGSSQAALEPTHLPHPCPLGHKPHLAPKASSLPSARAIFPV